MSASFFTMVKTYFHCCTTRCSWCYTTNPDEYSNPHHPSSTMNDGDKSPFSFDDLSIPSNQGTPIIWSSSSSSLDGFTPPYKRINARPTFKPYNISIIPTNYYSD